MGLAIVPICRKICLRPKWPWVSLARLRPKFEKYKRNIRKPKRRIKQKQHRTTSWGWRKSSNEIQRTESSRIIMHTYWPRFKSCCWIISQRLTVKLYSSRITIKIFSRMSNRLKKTFQTHVLPSKAKILVRPYKACSQSGKTTSRGFRIAIWRSLWPSSGSRKKNLRSSLPSRRPRCRSNLGSAKQHS